jgi:hypothetical protein
MFEIFSRKIRRTGNPSATFSKLGRLQLNKSATSVLEKEAVENVLLLWDAEKNLVGIRSISKKDARSYKVHYGVKGNGAGFSAKTFLDFIGMDYSESRSVPVERGEGDILFIAQIPNEYLVTNRQQHLVLEGGKKGKIA